MTDTIKALRRGVASAVLLAAAVFLTIAAARDELRDYIMSRAIFSPPPNRAASVWSLDPEMVELLQSGGKIIPAPVREAAESFADAGRVAAALFGTTAENIRNLASFIMEQNPDISADTALIQAAAFWKYSIKYDAPIDLVIAVAQTESQFNPGARSGAGAAGVMQVMWKVHSGLLFANGILDESQLYDPDLGIAAGSLLLSRYLRADGNTVTALGRYYGGPPEVYWKRVSRNLERLRKANIVTPSEP
ncbi:MAG: lytic transglycosylase domain-containing protein [Synergistaceae bacterium]|nr:transglycosylase SLT domain-containing protein [Synergistota bacterium]NLM70485.1 lytic transglycosylase domain-containing protein [Synergistaceae bacterium]